MGERGYPIVRVGVVGAGTVGSGVIQILEERGKTLLASRSGVILELAKVAELDRAKAIAAGARPEIVVEDFRAVVEDPTIDIVVELIGGVRTAETVVKAALTSGKAVVTANKALLAEKGMGLFALAQEQGVPLAFEASVAGGIPIILALREGLIANRITSLLGIVNGTCNYILTKMIEEGGEFAECLAEAQRLGYAEADPTFDIDGIDSAHKLALLSALAMECSVPFASVPRDGIRRIEHMDVDFAQQLGYTIKLLAVARSEGIAKEGGRLFLSVHPALLSHEHPLAGVRGSMNAIALHGDLVEEAMFYGRGAGKFPTASAVVADLIQVARGKVGLAPSPRWSPSLSPAFTLASLDDYVTRYYLRFLVEDRAGVLGQMATILGRRNVSIAMVRQHEGEADRVPVVIVTHPAREGDVRAALQEIGTLPFLRAAPVFYRIEG